MRKLLTACFAATLVTVSLGQSFLMMPDSTNNRIVTFDPFNGSVINSSLFGLAAGTPIHAMQVGTEIWVSEQVGDRVSRWDAAGTSLGAVTGGLDNIRGMGLINGTVYVTNAGTANGAPGAAVVMFDTSGANQGNFATPNAPSPFGILAHQGGMLVSSSSANDDIHRYSLTGTSLGTFHNSAIAFVEQMDYAPNGDVLAAVFTTGNISRFDPNSGALLSSFAASGARGVHQLGNGNIIWSNGSGVWIYDGVSSTQIYTGGGRYIDLYTPVPEPATLIAVGTGIAWSLRRRRKS